MKIKDIQTMEDVALLEKLTELKQELFNLRFSHKTRQLTNTTQINLCKKDIARVLTIMRQRNLKVSAIKTTQKVVNNSKSTKKVDSKK